ncbi:MAG TPA: glycosyltransferase family 4 protein [Candidatus Luteococcus avicola]|nr:glycosyltransferase family 4 protein [Candidatus Luteococcus avicola]
MSNKILVVNAGTHPEPAHLAAGLVAAGQNLTYLTSASVASDSRLLKAASLPGLRAAPLVNQLPKRALPHPLRRANVAHRAAGLEIFSQLVKQVRPTNYGNTVDLRTRLFNPAVGRWVTKNRPEVVIGQQTCALDAFRAAGSGARKVLNYPLAHHAWIEATMHAEAKRNPRWAPYLQGHDLTPAQRAHLDEEVALADHILVASEFVRRTFIESGIPEYKLLVELLGADVAQFGSPAPEPDRELGLRILFAGQLTQRKGLSYLVEGFASAGLDNATLRFVGPAIGDVDHLLTGPGVEVIGAVSKPELGRHYRWADLLVLPSLAEGFGLTALEAMACGTPCLLSTSTFADDVITPEVNGFIVPPADSEAIAQVFRRVANSEVGLPRMKELAAQRALELTWERYRHAAAATVLAAVSAPLPTGRA